MDGNGTIPDSAIRLGMRRGRRLAGAWFDSRAGQGADDLVQEAVIRAWGHWPRLRQTHGFPAMVCTIVRRLRYQSAARRTAVALVSDQGVEAAVQEDEVPCVRVCGLWVDREWLRDQLGPVLARQQALNRKLLLGYHEGFSCAELAERFGMSLNSVKTRLSRTRRAVREELEQRVRRESGRAQGWVRAACAPDPSSPTSNPASRNLTTTKPLDGGATR